MTDNTTFPYRCPKCFYQNRFPDVTTLRTHLELAHSYVQLSIPLDKVTIVTSSPSSSSPRSRSYMSNLAAVGSTLDGKKKDFKEQARELETQLFLAAEKDGNFTPRYGTSWPQYNSMVSQTSRLDTLLMSPSNDVSSPGYHGYKEYQRSGEDIDQVKQELMDKEHEAAVVEIHRLKQELMDKEHDLAQTTLHLQEIQGSKHDAEDKAKDLSQKVEAHSMEIAELKSQVEEQNIEIKQDERKLLEMSHFLDEVDMKQTTARDSLKNHLGVLVDRAEHAEMEILNQSIEISAPRSDRCPVGSSSEDNNIKVYRTASLRDSVFSKQDTPLAYKPRSPSKNKRLQQSSQISHPQEPSPLWESSTNQMSSMPLPGHIEQQNQNRQQQLDILQQQLETLQYQQNQLQQYLIQLSEQPTHVDQMEDLSPVLVKQLMSQTLQETNHGDLQTFKEQESSVDELSQSKPLCVSNDSSPYHGSLPNDRGKEMQHQHTEEPNPIVHHNTLPWQQSSILPSRHNNLMSLSSTLPSYAGSELPNFNIEDDNDDELEIKIQKTEAHFDSTYVEGSYMPSLHSVPEKRNLNTHKHHSDLNGSYYHPDLHGDQDLSSDNSNSDVMNFKVLEKVFQDIINRKQSSQSGEKQICLDENHGNSSELTSLPTGHEGNGNTKFSDARKKPLPNGIPTSPIIHTGSTFSSRNGKQTTNHNIPEIQIESIPNSVLSNRGLSSSRGTVSELSDIEDSFTDVTYTASVSVPSGYATRTRKTGTDVRPSSTPMTRNQENALLCIFTHMDEQSLLNCALVCRDWKRLSRHPSLWRTVRLTSQRISSKFLQTISSWCTELEWLYLDNLKSRKKHSQETKEEYKKDTRGCLEIGLEYLLHNSGSQLISLTIHNCNNILTERCLWLASCYCSNLCSVTYVSQTDPAGHEVIWALGAGCRKIESLKIPPGFPCDQPYKFNNRCTQMITRCWSQLKALSIGGNSVDGKGLVTIAKNCLKLQVLELDHMSKVTEPVAIAMTKSGLRGLQVLIFRHTPVTTKAILQFNGSCPQLGSMSIHLSPLDYFTEGHETSKENTARFEQLHKKLQVLAEQPGLKDVVHLYIMTIS